MRANSDHAPGGGAGLVRAVRAAPVNAPRGWGMGVSTLLAVAAKWLGPAHTHVTGLLVMCGTILAHNVFIIMSHIQSSRVSVNRAPGLGARPV